MGKRKNFDWEIADKFTRPSWLGKEATGGFKDATDEDMKHINKLFKNAKKR